MKKFYLHVEACYLDNAVRDEMVLHEILYNALSAFVRETFGDGLPGGEPIELEYGAKKRPQPTELEVFIGRIEKDLEKNGGRGIKALCEEWRETKG